MGIVVDVSTVGLGTCQITWLMETKTAERVSKGLKEGGGTGKR